MSQETVDEGKRDSASVDTNTLFSLLSRERRRYALYCLQQYENPMALADLADEVALLEHDARTVTEIPAEGVKSVYMTLYHTHVPKLADAGVAEYDQETDSVRLKGEFADLDLEDVVSVSDGNYGRE